MKVTKHETLYHEEHGATLKHKCGKKDSSNCPFFFSYSFFGPFFFLTFPFFLFFLWDNALKMMIITLILIYNSILQLDTRTIYDSI